MSGSRGTRLRWQHFVVNHGISVTAMTRSPCLWSPCLWSCSVRLVPRALRSRARRRQRTRETGNKCSRGQFRRRMHANGAEEAVLPVFSTAAKARRISFRGTRRRVWAVGSCATTAEHGGFRCTTWLSISIMLVRIRKLVGVADLCVSGDGGRGMTGGNVHACASRLSSSAWHHIFLVCVQYL